MMVDILNCLGLGYLEVDGGYRGRCKKKNRR